MPAPLAGAMSGERALSATLHAQHAARMHFGLRCRMSGSRRVARRSPTSLYVCRLMYIDVQYRLSSMPVKYINHIIISIYASVPFGLSYHSYEYTAMYRRRDTRESGLGCRAVGSRLRVTA